MQTTDWPKKIGEILFKRSVLIIYQSIYKNGRPAIFLEEDGLPFATLSVNLPEHPLKEGEFFVKNWFENQEIAPYVLEYTGLFEDTEIAVDTGHVKAPIWRFKKEE